MTTQPITPEHLQLLSSKRLEEVARTAPDDDEAAEDVARRADLSRSALSRLARYEIQRRRCEVPVRDRYDAVGGVPD